MTVKQPTKPRRVCQYVNEGLVLRSPSLDKGNIRSNVPACAFAQSHIRASVLVIVVSWATSWATLRSTWKVPVRARPS